MQLNFRIFFLLPLLSCAGSTGPIQSSFAITFQTESDPGVPLAEVKVNIDEEEIGVSDQFGLIQTIVQGIDGTTVEVAYQCPEGYRQPESAQAIRLTAFEALDPNSPGLQLRLECKPELRRVVFVVRAKKGGLPILLDGETVARTNDFGVAHFARAAPPNTRFQLRINTEQNEYIRPQNPFIQFQLKDADDVFTWDQPLEERRPPRRRRRRRRQPPPRMITRLN